MQILAYITKLSDTSNSMNPSKVFDPSNYNTIAKYVAIAIVPVVSVLIGLLRYLSEFPKISPFFIENRLAHLLGKKADLRKHYQGCEPNAIVSAAYQDADRKIEVKIAKITFRRSLNNYRHNRNFIDERRVSPWLMPLFLHIIYNSRFSYIFLRTAAFW